MKERIFNLFLIISDDIIREIGAVCYEQSGSDAQKLVFLQSKVIEDLEKAKRYPVPNRYVLVSEKKPGIPGLIRYKSYLDLAITGDQLEFFEEVFADLKAPQNPLMCITPIVDGKPLIDGYASVSVKK